MRNSSRIAPPSECPTPYHSPKPYLDFQLLSVCKSFLYLLDSVNLPKGMYISAITSSASENSVPLIATIYTLSFLYSLSVGVDSTN